MGLRIFLNLNNLGFVSFKLYLVVLILNHTTQLISTSNSLEAYYFGFLMQCWAKGKCAVVTPNKEAICWSQWWDLFTAMGTVYQRICQVTLWKQGFSEGWWPTAMMD